MNKYIKIILMIIALIAVLIIATFGYNYLSKEYNENESISYSSQLNSTAKTSEPKEKATDFTVYDKDGNKVNLSDYIGKPAVVNFWASWCGPCTLELPSFDKMYKKYGENVNFLMVNLTDGYQETLTGVNEFVSEKGYTFPVFFDTESNAANAYGIYSIPMTLFIDKSGDLSNTKIGAMDEITLEQNIKGLIS